jgi:hypothetical protein
MRRHLCRAGVFFAAGLLAATVAKAGNESWVSANGNDAGNCPRTAPAIPMK